MRVTADQLDRGDANAQVVYDASNVPEVSAPGGVALDNYFVYWLNKANGNQVGTVIRALQDPTLVTPSNSSSSSLAETSSSLEVVSLAANAVKCYGICIALGNIFYTDESRNVYGIPRAATARHNPVTISTALREPRGCAYDGDGTVYVADKDLNAVYQFASNMNKLTSDRPLTKAADLEGAYAVAVYVQIMD